MWWMHWTCQEEYYQKEKFKAIPWGIYVLMSYCPCHTWKYLVYLEIHLTQKNKLFRVSKEKNPHAEQGLGLRYAHYYSALCLK